jgi:probable HAF family extracellular repeat protein
MKTKHLAALLALCALIPARVHANAIAYSVTVLEGLGGSFGSAAFSINNTGQVVGKSYLPGNSTHQAVRWTGTTAENLAAYYVTESAGFAINDAGQVAGFYRTAGGHNSNFGAVWSGTTPASLGSLGGLNLNTAVGNAINNTGEAAGIGWITTNGGINNYQRAVRWTGTTPTNLGTLGGNVSFGTGINSIAQVSGYSTTPDERTHAVRWTGTTPADLGTLGGPDSWGYGINDSGQVAGTSDMTNGLQHAVRWTGMTPEDLGTLGGTQSRAYSINNYGDVLGMSYTTGNLAYHAFLYTGGSMHDLFTLLLPGSGVTALTIDAWGNAINDSGQIAATGTINGQEHALRLDPIPAPEPSALLLLASTGLLAGFRRSRRTSPSPTFPSLN